MLDFRTKPWDGISTDVKEAPTSLEALKLADLDWEVEAKQISTEDGIIPDWFANVRNTDGKVLGLVTSRYKICQNIDAFAFTDTLIGGDVRYETAGQLNGGKRIWLLARLPDTEIVGDKTEPYLCFVNTHDGSGAVRVCMTPVRVICQNTLNLALSTANRAWSAKHTGDINGKLAEAHRCLDMASTYMKALDEEADRLANIKYDEERVREVIKAIFGTTEDATDRAKANAAELQEDYMACYFAPDILKFRGTAWGAINAMADMVAHSEPHRAARSYKENLWGKIMAGHTLVDRMRMEVLK